MSYTNLLSPAKAEKIQLNETAARGTAIPSGSNPVRRASVVRRIPLSGAKGAGLYALVDEQDGEMLALYTWHLASNGYARNSVLGMMHRAILSPPQNAEIDHIDRNPLNNCRSNLRIVTHAQNLANTVKREIYAGKVTSSAYKGVYKDKRVAGGYRAEIFVDGVKYRLGGFAGEIEAARAYDRAALHFHGAAARLNFSASDYDSGEEWKPYRPKPQYSSYRGVSFNDRTNKWTVRVCGDKQNVYVGAYDSEIEAAHAYDVAACDLLGGRAKPNFPSGGSNE